MGQVAVLFPVCGEMVKVGSGLQRLAEEAERVAFCTMAWFPTEPCKILPVPLTGQETANQRVLV